MEQADDQENRQIVGTQSVQDLQVELGAEKEAQGMQNILRLAPDEWRVSYLRGHFQEGMRQAHELILLL